MVQTGPNKTNKGYLLLERGNIGLSGHGESHDSHLVGLGSSSVVLGRSVVGVELIEGFLDIPNKTLQLLPVNVNTLGKLTTSVQRAPNWAKMGEKRTTYRITRPVDVGATKTAHDLLRRTTTDGLDAVRGPTLGNILLGDVHHDTASLTKNGRLSALERIHAACADIIRGLTIPRKQVGDRAAIERAKFGRHGPNRELLDGVSPNEAKSGEDGQDERKRTLQTLAWSNKRQTCRIWTKRAQIGVNSANLGQSRPGRGKHRKWSNTYSVESDRAEG